MMVPVLERGYFTFVELGGTFVFAISGAMTAVKRHLDIFGVMVLAFAAGNAGGVARDAMLGATPVAVLQDWRYIAICCLAGLVGFVWYPQVERLKRPILVLDAVGLALFSVAGSLKALSFELGLVAAILLGVLTAIGGGVLRDVLVSEVPIWYCVARFMHRLHCWEQS